MEIILKQVGRLAAFVAIMGCCHPSLAADVGGYNVVASATSLVSSTGSFTTNGGSLTSVLTDNDPGTYAFSNSPGASVTLGFSSGVVNGLGNDFVLFELGTPDTFVVTLNGVTQSRLSASTGTTAGGFSLNAAPFDLSSFGIGVGASITNIPIGLDTPSDNDTLPSLSYAGVLNADLAPTPVPEPVSMAVFGTALVGLCLARRKITPSVRT